MLCVLPSSLVNTDIIHESYQVRLISAVIIRQIKKHLHAMREAEPYFVFNKRDVYQWYVGVGSDELKKIGGRKYSEELKKIPHVIEINNKYKADRKKGFPKSYRLAEEFWFEELRIVRIKSYNRPKNIYGNSKEWGTKELSSLYSYELAQEYLNEFFLPDLEVEAYNRICDAKDKDDCLGRDHHRYAIANMFLRDWWSKTDNFNRYHTPLVILPSEVRKYIQHDSGAEVIGYDFKNFQPSLLHFYKEAGVNREVPQLEQEKYFDLCSNGTLYEVLLAHSGSEYQSRERIKEAFLTILNLQNQWMINHPAFISFQQIFPTYAQIIFDIKEESHRNMAKFLQRKEADIVFGQVVRDFVREARRPFYTVHDSVMTTKRNHEYLRGIFSDVIANNNIPTRVSLI